MNQERRILRSAGKVGLATSLSRVFGYVRDAALALVLGAGFGMDAFAVAFRLANLFRRLVAEGAMNSAFVPIFVAYKREQTEEALWDFARKFFYTLALVAAVIVCLEIVFAPLIVRIVAPGFAGDSDKFELTVYLTRLMAPYLLFVALAALLMGVLNSLNHFVVPALSPVLFNLSVIGAAFSLAHLTNEPAVGIAYGVLVGGVLQLGSQLFVSFKKGMQFRPGISVRHPAIKKVGLLLAPSIFGVGIVQINLLIDSLMASFLREGSVSHLYYADRIMELVLGVFVISLATVILPDMARSASDRNVDEMKSTLVFSLRITAFIAIPATLGLFVLAEPIINVLFERGQFTALDTERTSVALAFYALGLCFISGVRLVVLAFYARQDTKTPVKIAAIALVTNAALNWILMHPLKQGGIALATSITSVLSLAQLLYAFQKSHGKLPFREMGRGVAKILGASGLMAVFCLFSLHICQFDSTMSIGWKVLVLFGTIAASIVVYLIACTILKADELNYFDHLNPFKRKSK